MHDLAHHRGRRAVRLVMRPRGPIDHPGRPFAAITLGPLLRRAPRHLEALRSPRDRPALLHDQKSQPQSSAWRQRSIGMSSVGHEDLLWLEPVLRQLHSTTGGLHPSTTSDRVVTHSRPTCLGITSSNGCYSISWGHTAARPRQSGRQRAYASNGLSCVSRWTVASSTPAARRAGRSVVTRWVYPRGVPPPGWAGSNQPASWLSSSCEP